MTSIEKLINSLENELESAWKLPMSGGKVFLDANEIKFLIDEVKNNLPMELMQCEKRWRECTKTLTGNTCLRWRSFCRLHFSSVLESVR